MNDLVRRGYSSRHGRSFDFDLDSLNDMEYWRLPLNSNRTGFPDTLFRRP